MIGISIILKFTFLSTSWPILLYSPSFFKCYLIFLVNFCECFKYLRFYLLSDVESRSIFSHAGHFCCCFGNSFFIVKKKLLMWPFLFIFAVLLFLSLVLNSWILCGCKIKKWFVFLWCFCGHIFKSLDCFEYILCTRWNINSISFLHVLFNFPRTICWIYFLFCL